MLDSIEGVMIWQYPIWNKKYKILAHIINIALIFAISSIFVLRHFVANFLQALNIENYHSIVSVWLISSAVFLLGIIIFGYATRRAWGNIQYLLARLAFLLYCFLYVPWWTIVLLSIGGLSLISVEGIKFNWQIKEMRKKDLRFR
ncbi:hypothetical protein KKB41_02205 [Patescibacteria group bacterium]|nr:hypothetical protein [Patescibacteria group bacterium]